MENKEEMVDIMIADRKVRKEIVSKSHAWFFHFYFPHYIKYEMAPFHEKMFIFTEDPNVKNAVIVAFRNSAKSTLFSLSFPIWAILGEQKIKHVLLLSGTQQKAQTLLQHIKREFETNRMLQSDLGPFREEKNIWNTTSLYVPKYDAIITCGSVEQSIRSIRFKQYRPQLIILDDIDDLESVKTKESRDKMDNWLTGEVIPAGDETTRLFVVGNLLHNDSVVKRLEKRIETGQMLGQILSVPVLDDNEQPTWVGKYKNVEEIKNDKLAKGLTETSWQREYMLKILPEDDQLVSESDIKYYDAIPPKESYTGYRFAVTSVDLAISQRESADYTAMVSAQVFGYCKDRKIYILPNPVNAKMGVSESIQKADDISRSLGNGISTFVWVEDVAYQKAYIEIGKEKGMLISGVSLDGRDKYSRLSSAASLIKSGDILFPRNGCENLINQIIGFGVEKHDDLVDAFTLIVLKLLRDDGGGRVVVPSPYQGIKNKETREEGEKKADQKIRAEREWERSNFCSMMAPHKYGRRY
jgi:predicted phage terminase large subunit-like protein